MIENESNNSEKNEIEIPHVEKTYDKLFSEITKLEKGDIIVRSNCKFCVHPARAEAEMKFESANRTNYNLIFRFFKEWEKDHPDVQPMNIINVRNHLVNHYMQQEKKLWLREYGERMKELMNYKMDNNRMFEMLSAALELKLHDIMSDINLDPIKQADTVTKIVKSKLEVLAMQTRLTGELEAVSILVQKFKTVWSYLINKEKDPEVKQRLKKSLDAFQSLMEGTVLLNTE